ncbi:MAG: efflux RND transporter periplasmic adaptor subunit [Bacteroidales bacterium]|nr:efflux RND transporter periplasmic adaptor subunit [Bacteroidales bacterium]
MVKYTRWILVFLVFLLLGGVIYFFTIRKKVSKEETGSLSGRGAFRQSVLHVNVEVLSVHPMTDHTVTTGDILPAEEVDLTFEISGKVVEICFNEGEFVKKGTVLAQINDAPLRAQLKKLESQVKLAQDRVYRQQALLEKDAVSREAFESVQTDYNKLQADIELVKAQLDQTELRAPFDGTIGLRRLSEGAYASPGSTIATLSKVSELKIEFSVPEIYAADIKKGTPIEFVLTDNQGKEKTCRAYVYAAEAGIDRDTRTLTVRALYANVSNELIPGRYVSVKIMRSQIQNAVSVPSEAIIPEMGENMVFVYRSGKAYPVTIEAGLRTESRVQALSGVAEGDTLIVSGVMQLRDGLEVTIDQFLEMPL